jgi:hypothetical protein
MFIGHYAVAFISSCRLARPSEAFGGMMSDRRQWICALFALIVPLVAHPRPCHAKDPLPRPPAVTDPVKLSDQNLFNFMSSPGHVMASWLDKARVAGCEDMSRREDAVGCQPFSDPPQALSPEALKRLLRILPEGTWVRSKESLPTRPLLDLGMKFRSSRMHVDLGVRLDSMELILFSPGERPVVGSLPVQLQGELASVAAQVRSSSPESVVLLEALEERWGPGVLKPDETAFTPCDCPGGNSEGEFVYYEEPPSPVTREQPECGFSGPARIILHVRVDKSGRTCLARVVRGDPLPAPCAMEAVAKWTWKPALSNNKPVCVWVEVPIDFP